MVAHKAQVGASLLLQLRFLRETFWAVIANFFPGWIVQDHHAARQEHPVITAVQARQFS
jgi:hypothetical protein